MPEVRALRDGLGYGEEGGMGANLGMVPPWCK